MSGQDVAVVVDPGVPEEVAWTFKANAQLLSRIKAGWRPRPEPDPAPGSPFGAVALVGAPLMLALAIVFIVAGSIKLAFLSFSVVVCLFLAKVLSPRSQPDDERTDEHEIFEQARWYDGRYHLPEDFDPEALALMMRTQRAVNSVLGSHVNAEGLLDDVRNAVMLPQQEWEIARLLAKLSALRAEHNQLIARGVAPEVAQAVQPLERALANSEAAVVARVEALERYAGHVADAERAYHARGQIEELRARLPRYEELVAESGADGFAVPEISRLADDADQLEETLRRSVGEAHEAFRYLDG
ncbi:hypothetical protein AB0B45_09495 [Nonomuraea sp. NPDC049152]|uniref:hypothetical protein n=1 Tax=Nonomuraea sp. NPDC049152 TaxID=3154350 RepID=UPI0033FCDFEB